MNNKHKDAWPASHDAKMLLAKHGKLGLDRKSTTPDDVIDAIANSMDATPPIQGNFKTPKTRLRSPTPESDADAMIKKYIKQNGSIIVPDNQSAAETKKQLESNGPTPNSKSNLICEQDIR